MVEEAEANHGHHAQRWRTSAVDEEREKERRILENAAAATGEAASAIGAV